MRFWKRRDTQGFLLVLPFLILFTQFVLIPLGHTIVMSLSGAGNPFANYIAAFQMVHFRRAMLHTLLYTVISSLLVALTALPMAILIQQVARRHLSVQRLLALPYVSGMMMLSLIHLMFFNTQNGLANKLMPVLNLHPQNWMGDPRSAFLCMLLLLYWRGFGFATFYILTAMSKLEPAPYEAMIMMGGGGWQMLRYITLPKIISTLWFIVPTEVIISMTAFEPIVVFHSAGMERSVTTTVVYEIYEQIISGRSVGVASAMASLLILPILLGCYLFSRRIYKRRSVR